MNRRQHVAHVVAVVVTCVCGLALPASAQDGPDLVGLRGKPGSAAGAAGAGGQARTAGDKVTVRDVAAPAATKTTREAQIVIMADAPINGGTATAYSEEHDEFMVGWTTIQDQWSHDIWARRLTPDGTLSEYFCVAAVAGNLLGLNQIAYCRLHEEYLFTFSNWYENTGDRADVQARRVAWNGGWMGDIFNVTPAVAEHLDPSIAYCAPCDEYLVTYTNEWPGGELDLYAQRIRASDSALLSWSCVATGGGWDRQISEVAFHPAMYGGQGGYLIAYSASTAGDWRLRYKMTHTDLSDLFSNPEFDASSSSAVGYYSTLDAGETGFLVAWYEWVTGGYQIRARRISAEGIALGPPEGFPVSGVYPGNPFSYGLAGTYAFGQRYLVLWSVEITAGIYDIHAAIVSDEADTTIGGVFALGNGVESILYPDASCSPSSVCLVTYSWLNGSSWDIAGQILDLLTVFSDGFESGDTSTWSAMVP